MSPRDRLFLASAALCAALLALPFFSVTVPPITDLPQQVAQMRLLSQSLEDPASPYRVQWSDPNKLGYLPLLLGWLLAEPFAAGRLAMAMIALLWVLAIHGLARTLGRHPAAAAAASLLVLNHVTYWGFLSFLVGFPVYAVWLLKLRRSAPVAGFREAPGWLLLTALLYSGHVLWLAAAGLSLLVAALLRRWPLRSVILRSLWLLPAAAAVAVWYPTFTAGGFESATTWGPSAVERLHPGWWVNSLLGGLQGPVEGTLLLALFGWLALGFWQSRRRSLAPLAYTPFLPLRKRREDSFPELPAADPGDRFDRWLATAGAGFLLAALVLPSVRQHTIFFASRWLPIAGVLLVLACPPPRLRQALRLAFPLLLVASLGLATTAAWIAFENDELDGLGEALARLPPGQRLLGLDFVRTSERVHGFPYYHLYAWGQALRGGELATTFANQASSLVVYRDLPRPVPWTAGLDWRAHRVRRSDMKYFDAVLIHGGPDVHALFLADERLAPVTRQARWRLYRVGVAGE